LGRARTIAALAYAQAIVRVTIFNERMFARLVLAVNRTRAATKATYVWR
jgi:hypothetical protein